MTITTVGSRGGIPHRPGGPVRPTPVTVRNGEGYQDIARRLIAGVRGQSAATDLMVDVVAWALKRLNHGAPLTAGQQLLVPCGMVADLLTKADTLRRVGRSPAEIAAELSQSAPLSLEPL